ncbi:MAG: hypothetical protein DCE90_02700 [Pseudanabaena sp.]|nr:MAG: hypothetical protein DCE90_02700 [Pseudanabaena sp.]
MKFLPESSKPDSKALTKNLPSTELSPSSQDLGDNSGDPQGEIDPRDRLTWSDFYVVLSIPIVSGLTYLGLIYLYNPSSISWLAPSEAPAFYSSSLWNAPKSIKQIQKELGEVQLKLGEKYGLQKEQYLYTVLETETQNIREIRLYQTIWDRGEEKFLLVSTTTVAGVDEYFVRSPLLKYATSPPPERLQPNRKRLPLKKLSRLKDSPSDYGGTWFATTGNVDGIAYGQIYYFVEDQRSQLFELESWTSPTGELPNWQRVLSNQTWQLVVNQTQKFEPLFTIWQPEVVTNQGDGKPINLRQITLNEAKNQPPKYREALVLASVGLWSPALEILNAMTTEMQSQGQSLSPYLQEQYDLISFHAQITSSQTQKSLSNLGEKALVSIIDGQWEEAIAIANDPDYKGDQIAEMLAKYHPHIWQRVTTLLTYTGVKKEIKLWGGLVVLHRNGLRRAENWLRSQKVDAKDYDQLLQRLDLAPIAIKPNQLIGTVNYIGRGNAGADWFLPPPKLEEGQAWYEVSISLLRDGNQWINAPFAELSDRSSLLLWRILGLSLNPNLGVVLYDAYGKSKTANLTAQSLWVSESGSLKILATGEVGLAPLLSTSTIAPLVTSGGAFAPPSSTAVDWQIVAPETIERIIRSMYSELQRNGQVSLEIEEFSILVQQQWTLLSVNLDGFGKPEYLLLLDREQVDLGDRHYPLAIAFTSEGSLLFSDVSGGRIWIDVLPSSTEGQILTLRDGRYEVWRLR